MRDREPGDGAARTAHRPGGGVRRRRLRRLDVGHAVGTGAHRPVGIPAVRELPLRAHGVDRHRGGPYLEDGADSLLVGIAASGHAAGILTYGGEDWQTIKLRATELDSYRRMILAEKGKKGALIASWYDAEHGVYRLPEALGGGSFDEIVLVDDKPAEFVGFPDLPSAHGYLYTGGVKPTIETSPQPVVRDLPASVKVVDSLRDIVRREEL